MSRSFAGESTVLLVQPDRALAERLSGALQARGISAVVARDGRDALEQLDRQAISLAVVDAELPSLSGFDLVRSLRQHPRGASVAAIITTNVVWAPAQKAALLHQTGILDLLVKPVDPLHLAELASGVLGGQEGTEELADAASYSEQRQVERATRAAQAGGAELRGNLSHSPFPVLLHRLYRTQASGALFLLNGQVKKIVYFRDGHPIFIKSNRLSECLGKILVRQGMISEAQCRESLRRMNKSTRQQGTVLIEMGVISPHELVVGLDHQLQVKLMDIFSWTRGDYLFRSEGAVAMEGKGLEVSNASLIADGVRFAWDEPRLDHELGPHLDCYPLPNPDPAMRFQELSLDQQERDLLNRVDGSRTLRQLLSDTPLPQRRAKAVCYILLVTEVVVPEEGRPALDELPPLSADDASLREQLATALLQMRRQDAFSTLGLQPGCSDVDVMQQHAELARRFHPDRYRHLSAETRRMAQDIFRLINEAFDRIATGALRKEYRTEGARPQRRARHTGEWALQAEQARRQSLELMQQEHWGDATALLEQAVKLCPNGADLHALLGWALFNTNPQSEEVARSSIRELRLSVSMEPWRYEPYLYLGRVYGTMGKTIMAEKQYEKALQCNPDCHEALEELRIQQERRPPRRFRG